ncbi:hypothetical protein CSIM01_04463 [Colletotrichum simmondsii]|uniref:Uncharacterized protein n=1 Tax=Colletotrichum simmondsii TaxID=703756 RepID=A0A135T7N7_9PEZI|nr:hypothetical protein CSIM01_04463 [Colletotrichum simmondsii]
MTTTTTTTTTTSSNASSPPQVQHLMISSPASAANTFLFLHRVPSCRSRRVGSPLTFPPHFSPSFCGLPSSRLVKQPTSFNHQALPPGGALLSVPLPLLQRRNVPSPSPARERASLVWEPTSKRALLCSPPFRSSSTSDLLLIRLRFGYTCTLPAGKSIHPEFAKTPRASTPSRV